jgi:L-rhamnose mutarotase
MNIFLNRRLLIVKQIQRFGSVIGIRKEKIDEYKHLHANAWPEILEMIEKCNIRNYSIYLAEPVKDKFYLFSYFEYIGDDFDADTAKMAADPKTQKWWKLTNPCQKPVPNAQPGQWWVNLEEVFHAG